MQSFCPLITNNRVYEKFVPHAVTPLFFRNKYPAIRVWLSKIISSLLKLSVLPGYDWSGYDRYSLIEVSDAEGIVRRQKIFKPIEHPFYHFRKAGKL